MTRARASRPLWLSGVIVITPCDTERSLTDSSAGKPGSPESRARALESLQSHVDQNFALLFGAAQMN